MVLIKVPFASSTQTAKICLGAKTPPGELVEKVNLTLPRVG